jgi:hypothetical protein
MKLNEITAEPDEPIIVTLVKSKMAKGERVARYYVSGSGSKPMWITDIARRSRKVLPNKPGPQETLTTWTFFGDNGPRIVVYTQDELENGAITLIPGKTKKTWQLTRAKKSPINEGRGDELMAYMDFADKNYPSVAQREKYDALANKLFKRGFAFEVLQIHGLFIKINKNKTQTSLAIQSKEGSQPARDLLHVVVLGANRKMVNTGTIFSLDDLIGDDAEMDDILAGKNDAAS